jgi:hypothetical protein|tara:strand:- start:2028 stop:2225 length:198 start_codon:yes stop_codon:yes gene_type:complete
LLESLLLASKLLIQEALGSLIQYRSSFFFIRGMAVNKISVSAWLLAFAFKPVFLPKKTSLSHKKP